MRKLMGMGITLMAVGVGSSPLRAAQLLYDWNFDSNGGSGNTVNPAATPNNTASDGGVLSMSNYGGFALAPSTSPTGLYSSSGGGVSGKPGDYAFDNSASVSNNNNPGGITYSTGAAATNNVNTVNALPNFGAGNAVTAYTLTMWVKPTAAELTQQSRLFEVSTTAATSFDEGSNGLWVGLNAGKVQTGGSSAGSNSNAVGNTLVANAWNFIAVEVDLAATNVYYDPAMQAANGQNDSFVLYQGDSTSGVYGVTGQNGFANGTVSFASQGDYVQLLNRASNANRAFQGLGDDFRIYNGLLSTSDLNALTSAEAVPEPASVGVIIAGGVGLMARRRRSN